MQKNTTHLFYALICLSVAVPMLSGCRFNGAPYRPSSWELYSLSSKEYFAPFASKESSDYDEAAIARQIDSSPELPKTDITAPRDGYLNNKETKIADQKSRKTSDPYSDLLNGSESGSSSLFAETAKPQPAESLFSQNSNATSQPPPVYGTTSPIDSGFGSSGGAGQMASHQASAPFGTTSDAYSAATPGNMNAMSQGAGMVAAASMNSQIPADPAYSAYGQPYPQVAAATGIQQGQTGNPSAYPTSNTPYNGAFAGNTTPQMVASNQGTGYVGQGPDYGSITPSQGMSVNGTTQGVMTNPQGQPYSQVMPTANGNAPVYQSGMPNPSATDMPNPYQPTMPQNASQPYGTQPYGTQQQPYYGGQPQPYYPAAATVNQGGFSSFAATGDDLYRPGGTQ